MHVEHPRRLMRAMNQILRFTSCVASAFLFVFWPPMGARAGATGTAQSSTQQTPQRTRLILKDGSFQVVLSYNVVGDVVRFRSAERNGEIEDIPLALVDLPATEKWKKDHIAAQSPTRPVLSPELEKEEAARRALSPEIASDLRLPEEDSVLALDAFRGAAELVPVPQYGSDLNKETAHAALKSLINPASVAHPILTIPGSTCDIQLHTAAPLFFVRVGGDDEDDDARGGEFTVDTHGASGRATPSGGVAKSGYVLQHLDVRGDARVLNSFRIAQLGTGRRQPDVIETAQDVLPGGRWMKLTPEEPLEPGEYALVEVLSDHEVNLNVWDFGIHPNAKDNFEAIHPAPEKPKTLERRRPD
jgi:hypothetical protein